MCPECQLDIQNNRLEAVNERKKQQEVIAREKGAIALQSHFRSFVIKKGFKKQKRGATILESRFRGLKARRQLQAKFSVKRRPFKIRVLSAAGLTAADIGGTSDPLVHVAVVDGSDSETQLFHFQTKTKKGTLHLHFNDTFQVPGADGNVTIVFTARMLI